jgi:hypothetical protein
LDNTRQSFRLFAVLGAELAGTGHENVPRTVSEEMPEHGAKIGPRRIGKASKIKARALEQYFAKVGSKVRIPLPAPDALAPDFLR